MRSYETTADSSGKVALQAGYGLAVSPVGAGAAFPVTLVLDNNEGAPVQLDDARAVYLRPWGAAELRSSAGAKWRIWLAEGADEVLGAPPSQAVVPVRLGTMVLDGELLEGDYTFNAAGTYDYDSAAPLRFDVRRYRGVLLTFTVETFVNVTATKVGAYLKHFPTSWGNDAGETIEAGSANDVKAGGLLARVHLGETAGDSSGTLYTCRGDRAMYVEPRVTVTGGTVETDGDVRADLWGLP